MEKKKAVARMPQELKIMAKIQRITAELDDTTRMRIADWFLSFARSEMYNHPIQPIQLIGEVGRAQTNG